MSWFKKYALKASLSALWLSGCGPTTTDVNPDAGPAVEDAGSGDIVDASVPPSPDPTPSLTQEVVAEGAKTVDSVAGGRFAPLAGYAGNDATGHALLVRESAGTYSLSVQVSGVSPNVTYPAHLHRYPCDVGSGGPHYKIDPGVAETVESNEIWPSFTTDENGNGEAEVSGSHVVRQDAQSVVIHDPESDNAKMLCADLRFDFGVRWASSGTFSPYAAAEAVDNTISGSVELFRTNGGTGMLTNVNGLAVGESYVSHVHEQPCEVTLAGGHYKIDPSVDGAVESNELWPDLSRVMNQSVSDTQSITSHMARRDAQSVVIHRIAGDAKPKVACANLTLEDQGNLISEGNSTLLQRAIDESLATLATASLERRLDGTAVLRIDATGLRADALHKVHVHNQPCSHGSGGGHYMREMDGTEVSAETEMWAELLTDGQGAASWASSYPHMPRASAQSVVIHDNDESKSRLVCIDLD